MEERCREGGTERWTGKERDGEKEYFSDCILCSWGSGRMNHFIYIEPLCPLMQMEAMEQSSRQLEDEKRELLANLNVSKHTQRCTAAAANGTIA